MVDETQILLRNLDLFNSSVIHLLELVNSNWNAENCDSLDLLSLQKHADDMHSIILRVIKAKSENIMENIIPTYFDRLAAVECSPTAGRKRKLVTFKKEEAQYYERCLLKVPQTVASPESLVSAYCDSPAALNPLSIEEIIANPTVHSIEWSEDEEIFLKELVSRHKSGAKGKRVVDWSSVARELHRNELDCKVKWNALCNAARTRKGPYKVEEDQLIMTKVTEYLNSSSSSSDGGGSGCDNDRSGAACNTSLGVEDLAVNVDPWLSLEKALRRPAKNIRLRWRITLSKKQAGGAVGTESDDASHGSDSSD